jgi:hypothetical protein
MATVAGIYPVSYALDSGTGWAMDSKTGNSTRIAIERNEPLLEMWIPLSVLIEPWSPIFIPPLPAIVGIVSHSEHHHPRGKVIYDDQETIAVLGAPREQIMSMWDDCQWMPDITAHQLQPRRCGQLFRIQGGTGLTTRVIVANRKIGQSSPVVVMAARGTAHVMMARESWEGIRQTANPKDIQDRIESMWKIVASCGRGGETRFDELEEHEIDQWMHRKRVTMMPDGSLDAMGLDDIPTFVERWSF